MVRKGATERRRKIRAMGRLLRRRSQATQVSVGRSSGAALERKGETYLTRMFSSDAPRAPAHVKGRVGHARVGKMKETHR